MPARTRRKRKSWGAAGSANDGPEQGRGRQDDEAGDEHGAHVQASQARSCEHDERDRGHRDEQAERRQRPARESGGEQHGEAARRRRPRGRRRGRSGSSPERGPRLVRRGSSCGRFYSAPEAAAPDAPGGRPRREVRRRAAPGRQQAVEDAGELVRSGGPARSAAGRPGPRPAPSRRAPPGRRRRAARLMGSSGSTHVPPPTSVEQGAGGGAGRRDGEHRPAGLQVLEDLAGHGLRLAPVDQQQGVGRALVAEGAAVRHEGLDAHALAEAEPVGVGPHAALVDADEEGLHLGRLRRERGEERGRPAARARTAAPCARSRSPRRARRPRPARRGRSRWAARARGRAATGAGPRGRPRSAGSRR